MRVVLVSDFPRTIDHIGGGVEAVVVYLLESLALYDDLELDVVTMDRWNLGARKITCGGVDVHFVAGSRMRGPLRKVLDVQSMKRKIIELAPDVVHAQIAGRYAEAARRTGFPWVLTLHGIRYLEAHFWEGFVARTYRKALVKREELRSVHAAEHVISINPFIQDIFHRDLRGKVYEIENPVSTSFFSIGEGTIGGRILFAGRLIPRKAVHVAIQAFAKVHARHPEARLRVAGGGVSNNDSESYVDGLTRQVAELQLDGAVEFLGELEESELLEEYRTCQVLLSTSVLETAPMVITQAMAASRAVVSTSAGGVRYMVGEGESGFVVPIDDVDAIADRLHDLIADPNLAAQMGRHGNCFARQRNHVDAIAARTREVYYQVVGAQAPNSAHGSSGVQDHRVNDVSLRDSV